MKTSPDLALQDRVLPPCPHFGRCGGCQLQHLAYPAQLSLKSARLSKLLDATGLVLPELQVHASPPLNYRNRIRLTLSEVAGQLRAGYLRRPIDPKAGCATSGLSDADFGESTRPIRESTTPTFLPITECPIAAPILWRATEAFLALIDENPANWLRNPHSRLDQLEIFATGDESALQFTLYVRTAAKTLAAKLATAFAALCETLRACIPELTGASIAILPLASKDRSRRNEQPRSGPSWGSPGLNYTVPTQSQAELVILSEAKNPRISPLPLSQPIIYWVPRGAFFQTNRFLLPELLILATANRAGQLAFDLYAGVGLFSRALARSFAQVTAVEIAEPAASALASHKLPNLRAVKATTLDFLRTAAVDRSRPDLIVLDPPRTGAGLEVCALLGRIAAPTLIYVSCSPETLPADLTTLAASGYRVAELHLVDLFPQSDHIETIAALTR